MEVSIITKSQSLFSLLLYNRCMKSKYVYAVAVGRAPGVYGTWAEAKHQVDGFFGARYKKFASLAEAEAFVKGKGSVILGQFGINMEETGPIAIPLRAECPHASDTIVAFTDGSALNNGRKNAKAGYAVVFPNHMDHNVSATLNDANPTNNRAEYRALLTCLEVVESKIDPSCARKLVVYTDSKLLLDSITKWMKGWKNRNWIKSDGKPVLNTDLLQAIDAKLVRRNVQLHHVLAHTGRDDWKSRWNDMADKMARDAAATCT